MGIGCTASDVAVDAVAIEEVGGIAAEAEGLASSCDCGEEQRQQYPGQHCVGSHYVI